MERAKRVTAAVPGASLGNITRGTTAPNRLRRSDRWLTGTQAWRLRQADSRLQNPGAAAPLVVDLGFGADPITTLELYQRLNTVSAGVELIGIEIDPARVAQAQRLVAQQSQYHRLSFRQGGFEIPTERNPAIIRAFNVLRQYDAADVPDIWATVTSRLSPSGIFIDGTCDELGRRSSWISLSRQGPETLSFSLRLGDFTRPSDIAERLPKALIHRNVPGEPVHRLLQDLDRHWLVQAPLSSFSSQQRWLACCKALKAAGWPVLDGPSRWRLGELTLAWRSVAPAEPQR